jgi:hypothetical protein
VAIDALSLQRPAENTVSKNVWIVLVLFAVALITRAPHIGDPAISIDEQFYLLVGDRMWHGALPYVDIWDRKPILLFLIYAALRPLSPDGIVAYQVGALLFATATAFVIVIIAQRIASLLGACLAGVAYLLYLPLLDGAGGQAAVFYNLLMALGALEIIRAGEDTGPRSVWLHGLRCMICVGLAIQVKYTAAIEGIGFGLWLIWLMIQRNGGSVRRAVPPALWWAMTALAPTLAVTAFYVLIGHGWEFAQANFVSIFQRQQPADFSSLTFLVPTAQKLAPLVVFTAYSGLKLARSTTKGPRSFLALWTAFAVLGTCAIGAFYDQYALPLLVPATIVWALALADAIVGAMAIAALGVLAILAVTGFYDRSSQFDQARIAAMVEAARPYAAQGCIYIYNGPSIVYLLTHSCLPTRYSAPDHLSTAGEARATDATQSMAKLLAGRPSAIFFADRPYYLPRNDETAAMLTEVLARDYTRIAVMPDLFQPRQQMLYVRNDLLPPQGMQGTPSADRSHSRESH